jgi:membrane-bound serine protease (ClpP class)
MRKDLLAAAVILLGLSAAGAGAPAVTRIHLDKAIQPITEQYVLESIKRANESGTSLILLDIDTPGGYVSSVETIQRAILSSKAPVVAYVTPAGARAASGGALVALACDLIAMAPGTSIGSAHPVSALPFSPSAPSPLAPPGEPGKTPQTPREAEVMMEKVVNDLAAHVRSLAENRGRNAALAEKMVRESVSFTEKEALAEGLIEMVAGSEKEVLGYVSSHPLRRFDGAEQVVSVPPGTVPADLLMNPRQRFLSALADPTLAFLLLVLGILGLVVEFKSPGLIFPGVLGGIFILLWLMSTPILPPNVVGVLLILLAIIFFILEVKVVSYGMLGIGGVVSLVIGSLLLYSRGPVPEMRLSILVVLPVALAFGAILVFLLTLAAKALKSPVATGKEAMAGLTGQVKEPIGPGKPGKVFVFGEYWNAVSEEILEPGEKVRVLSQEGMTLKVAKA